MKTLSVAFILIFFLVACSSGKSKEIEKSPRNIEFIYSSEEKSVENLHYYGERYFEE